jgi:hypothetical protein
MHEIGIVCFMSSERLARMRHMSKCYMYGSLDCMRERLVGLFGKRGACVSSYWMVTKVYMTSHKLARDRTPQDRRRPVYSVASGANSQKHAQNGTP